MEEELFEVVTSSQVFLSLVTGPHIFTVPTPLHIFQPLRHFLSYLRYHSILEQTFGLLVWERSLITETRDLEFITFIWQIFTNIFFSCYLFSLSTGVKSHNSNYISHFTSLLPLKFSVRRNFSWWWLTAATSSHGCCLGYKVAVIEHLHGICYLHIQENYHVCPRQLGL